MDTAHAKDLKWENGSQHTEISVGLGLSHVCSTKIGQPYMEQPKKVQVLSLFWGRSEKLLSSAQIKPPSQCRDILQQQKNLNDLFDGYSGLLQVKVETVAPLDPVFYRS